MAIRRIIRKGTSLCNIYLNIAANLCTLLQLASVNLFGAIRVRNAFLPLVRKSQGRIANVSSFLGRFINQFMGVYSISKHGLEAYSNVLRLEMKRFNVKVVVIKPGNFTAATDVVGGKEGYAKMARRLWDQLDKSMKADYGKESLENEIEMGHLLTDFSVDSPCTRNG